MLALVDAGVDNEAEIDAFLMQRIGDEAPSADSWLALAQLVARLESA